MSFAELGLAEPILRAVVGKGYSHPTPIQLQAIPHVIAGQDLLGCAQTGTGKTAAFALPILHRLTQNGNPPKGRGRRIRVLVLSPTRELTLQISQNFLQYGQNTALKQTVVFGGVNQNPQTRALQKGVDIVTATPGRLLDLMNQGYVDLQSVEIFVLDEADRMLDMGFLPDIRRIIAKLPQKRQTLLFSATMPDHIRELADSILHNPAQVRIAPVQATTDLVDHLVYMVAQQQKTQLLSHFLKARPEGRTLIFTRTKHGADGVVSKLARAGISAEAIHGNKSQNARQRALLNFRQNRIRILVATDIAARGIDVDGVTHVINYDLPHEPETYVHRIGRTGRAGAKGIAVSFCDGSERRHLQAIQREIRRTLPVAQDAPAFVTTTAAQKPSGQPARSGDSAAGSSSRNGARPGKFGKRSRSFGGSKSSSGSGAPGPLAGRRPPKKKKRPALAANPS